MGYEVELKAHVTDSQALRARIVSLRGIGDGVSEHKADVYWSLPGERPIFRVREESTGPIEDSPTDGKLVFTRKDKQLQGAIEVNHEIEFTARLEDAAAVHEFCLSLGYVEYVRKEKRGWSWNNTVAGTQVPPVHLELIEVTSLGWFLEMECILDDDVSQEQVQQARSALLALLADLDVPQSDIEPRYYMDLLMNR